MNPFYESVCEFVYSSYYSNGVLTFTNLVYIIILSIHSSISTIRIYPCLTVTNTTLYITMLLTFETNPYYDRKWRGVSGHETLISITLSQSTTVYFMRFTGRWLVDSIFHVVLINNETYTLGATNLLLKEVV